MPTTYPDTPLLTRNQIAEVLSVTRNYLDHAARRGEGPPFFRVGGAIRYDRAMVAAWLAEHRQQTGAPE